MNETSFPSYDYILIGGGLQSGLLALALRHYRPSDRVLILEAADRVGGNHTWCCHAQDLPPTAHWSESLFCHEWEAFSVRFPGLERTVRRPYRCVTSEHFEQLLRALSKDNVENAGGVELPRTVLSLISPGRRQPPKRVTRMLARSLSIAAARVEVHRTTSRPAGIRNSSAWSWSLRAIGRIKFPS